MTEWMPVNKWVLVEKLEEEERKSKGGIILANGPTKEEEKTCDAKVLKISGDVLRAVKDEKKDLPYKVGDLVKIHSKIGIKYDNLDKSDKRYWIAFDAPMAVAVGTLDV